VTNTVIVSTRGIVNKILLQSLLDLFVTDYHTQFKQLPRSWKRLGFHYEARFHNLGYGDIEYIKVFAADTGMKVSVI